MKKYLLSILSASLLTGLSLSGCGGGGGGGGGSSDDLAARVYLSVSPGVLDTGDRTTVTVLIEQVNDDGAAIKIRFPVGLKYILASSELEIDGDDRDIAPTANVSDENNSYLVYYLRKGLVGDGRAMLSFKLLGVDKVTKGQIEVDADLDDPAIDNQDEFSIENPLFAAEDGDGVEVKG